MLSPSVTRLWNGVRIAGQQFEIDIDPYASGRLGVNVVALPEMTGFDRPCRLGDTEARRIDFLPSEIIVSDTELSCLSADRYAPVLRQGFVLTLEPGMAQLLRAHLPALGVVATVSQQVADLVAVQIAPPIDHLLDCIPAIAARIVLDRYTLDDAITAERRRRERDGYRDMLAVLDQVDSERIKALLDAVASQGVPP